LSSEGAAGGRGLQVHGPAPRGRTSAAQRNTRLLVVDEVYDQSAGPNVKLTWMLWLPAARAMGPKSNTGLLAVKVWLTVVVPTVRLTVRLPVRRVRPFRSRWALRVSPALALTVEVAVAVWFPDPAEPL